MSNDAFDVYERLWYPWGVYEVSEGKRDTYLVEANEDMSLQTAGDGLRLDAATRS